MLNDCSFEPPSWDELKKPMVELLLKYYNGEDQGSDFCSSISAVLRVLCRWNNFGQINPQSLLNFIIDQILSVIGEVKNKLVTKAIDRYELLSKELSADEDGAPAGPQGNKKYIKDYPDCPMAFDQMIISIHQYFELVDLNSIKLEDLWLNLLEVLNLERPNKYTVFKAVHHQSFRNIILKDPLMQQIIREVESYKDSGLACMHPAKYLERIYNIRRNCATAEGSYRDLAEQGMQSEALRQLVDFLFDEVVHEMRA